MKVETVAETIFFRLNSHGNGLAYELREINGTEEESLFFQGDDADRFKEYYDDLSSYYKESDVLAYLWFIYSPT